MHLLNLDTIRRPQLDVSSVDLEGGDVGCFWGACRGEMSCRGISQGIEQGQLLSQCVMFQAPL